MFKSSLLIILLFCIFLAGCNETIVISEKPDAEEALRLDKEADIFQWGDSIYQTNINWIDELELNENKQIGEIKFNVTKAKDFKNTAANHLPIGAKIYSVKERNDILIVKYDNVIKRYLVLVEG